MKILNLSVLVLLIHSSCVLAKSIGFTTHGFYYDLNTSQEEIRIKGYLIDLSFKKKNCNKQLIASLHDKIIKALRKRVLVEKDYYLVSWDGNQYKISKSSELGVFLYNFPNIAKVNKEKEAFLCRKEIK